MRAPAICRPVAGLAVFFAAFSLSAAELHVSTAGLDANPGTSDRPFKTISAAAAIAHPGDVVTVHQGTYRERINPPRGGVSDARRIVYRAAPGEKVLIKGSEIVGGWKKLRHDTWQVVIPNSLFGDFNPYSDVVGGEWYNTPKDGFDRHTGAVYLNGDWLDEAQYPTQLDAPVGNRPLWTAEVGDEHTTIRAQFKDVNPNKELVEINVRQSVFYPDKPGRNFITVRGFTMCQAATPWSGAMSEQIGLLGTHWSRGWIIENNLISHSMNTGVTLGRYDLGHHGIPLPPATAPGFVRSCELALQHGWSEKNIGSHVVRNNQISHCEKNGIHGSLGGIFSTIENNTIHDIATRAWISGPDVAGIKLLASHDAVIRNNHLYRCRGTGGIWLDWMAQGTRVTRNLLHDNRRDLFMEVNHGPYLIDHNLFLSTESIQDWSQGGAYAHNLIAGTLRARTETRQTPWFDPHSTQGMRLSDIRHRDLRFHNNIFIGAGRLAEFSKATGNLHASGNVYTGGSQPTHPEDKAVITPDFQPRLSLTRKSDAWWLEMSVAPAWTSGAKRDLVTTALLGNARIPDARFEQPDRSPYRIDTDFFGARRNTSNPTPGPFKFANQHRLRIKVRPFTRVPDRQSHPAHP